MKMIEVSEDALNSIKAMAEKLQGERDMLVSMLHRLSLAAENLGTCEGVQDFNCEFCGALCSDSPIGYVTGCEHYPPDVKPLPADMAKILHDNLWDLYERDDKVPNAALTRLP